MLITDNTNPTSPSAGGTTQTGWDAVQARDKLASQAQAKASGTAQALDSAIDKSKTTRQDVLNTARDLAGTAKEIAGDAWKKAQTYATTASGVAAEKLDVMKARASDLQATTARRIADEPIKAVAIGAAAGALLAAIVMRRGRGPRSY